MSDELSKVTRDIEKIEPKIEEVEEAIKKAQQDGDTDEVRHLREKERQLREKERQLRDERLLLLGKGAVTYLRLLRMLLSGRSTIAIRVGHSLHGGGRLCGMSRSSHAVGVRCSKGLPADFWQVKGVRNCCD
jgi:hypothetical protein